ncbi:MAG: LptA/OstA family protein, partial [bacterium]
VHIVDGETEITSEAGEYFRHERKAHLYGDVLINDRRQLVQADEVAYYRDSRIAVATGSVSFKDAANDVTVEGGRGTYYFEEGRGVMKENPILTASGEKQILVTARTMETFTKEGKASAAGDVKIYQGDLTASCDSLIYMSREEVASLLGNSLIVERQNRAESQSMRLEFENRRLKRAILKPDARGVYQGGEGERNEVFGDEMIIEFGEGKAREVSVNGSASGVYLLREKGE